MSHKGQDMSFKALCHIGFQHSNSDSSKSNLNRPVPHVASVALLIRTWITALTLVIGFANLAQAQTLGPNIIRDVGLATTPNLDSNGWTVFTPSSDTHIVYVSSSIGNDSNSGLSTSTPVKTIAHGLSLLRRGYPDWLLLKKGDTWTEDNFLHVSGRSPTEPMLISSYDPSQPGVPDPYGSTLARPIIKISSTLGGAGFAIQGGGGAQLGDGNNIAFVGLELYGFDRDPSSPNFNAANAGNSVGGIEALLQITWMLIEDCKIGFASEAIGIDAEGLGGAFDSNVTIRRNV